MKDRIAQIVMHLEDLGIDRRLAWIPASRVEGGYVPKDGDEVTDLESIYTAPARTDPDGTRYPSAGTYRAADGVVDCRPSGGFQHAVGPTSCLALSSSLPSDFLARANAYVARMNSEPDNRGRAW